MFQVLGQNIENFSRNSYFQVGGLHVRVRVLILVCAEIFSTGRHYFSQTDIEVDISSPYSLKK